MRLIAGMIGSAALAAAIIGCSGAPAGPTLAPGQTATPAGSTETPVTVVTPTPPPNVNPAELCAGMPTFTPGAQPTSFPQDATLNAQFPTEIDGQPVTNVQSSFVLEGLCYGGSMDEVGRFAAVFPNAGTVSSGSGQVELNGETVYFSAFRTPGTDPNTFFSNIEDFIVALGGDPDDAVDTTVSTTNLDGTNVWVLEDANDNVSYNYVSGDTIWSATAKKSVARKVFAAVQ